MIKDQFLVLVVIRQFQKERHQILHDHSFIVCFPIQEDGLWNDLINIVQISFIQLFYMVLVYNLPHNINILNQNDFNRAKINDSLIIMMKFMI